MKPIEQQTILVTGSTDGIGEITAHKLAKRGARVLVHGRSKKKVTKAAEKIRNKTGSEKIEGYVGDLSALKNVRQLADHILADHDQLDVMINNAGLGFSDEREISEDGYELRFAVNYLSHFLLTKLLMPIIEHEASSRIVNVASVAQREIDFNNVMLEQGYTAWRAYRQSKLAMIMFTFELAKRFEEQDKDITANTLHPGTFLETKIVREYGIPPKGKPETGAEVELFVATSPKLEGVTGKYFNQTTEAEADPQAYDEEARQKLWKLSNEYTGISNFFQ